MYEAMAIVAFVMAIVVFVMGIAAWWGTRTMRASIRMYRDMFPREAEIEVSRDTVTWVIAFVGKSLANFATVGLCAAIIWGED
jgi:hypothetical protein